MACLRNFSLLAFATFGLLQQSHDSHAAKVMDQGKDLALERALARFFKGNLVSKETAAGLSKEAMGALRAAGRRAQTSPACTTGVQIQSFAQTSDGDQAIADASREFLLEEGVADSDAHFLSIFFAELLGDAMRAPPSAFAEVGATVNDKAVEEVLPRGGFDEHTCDTPTFFRTGDEYCKDIYNELQTLAKGDEIIIAGWKHEFAITYLLGEEHPESNLQQNLINAAKRGANVYVQFWGNAVTAMMSTFSNTFIQASLAYELAQLHDNIHVFFDTGRGALMSNMWSHHIKAVVIDRKVATAGRLTIAHVTGLDFALGRRDTKFFLRPSPERKSTEVGWLDAGVKITGAAARDVRQALTSRHASYCSSNANMAHRKAYWPTYDQCDVKHIPAVNPQHSEAIGSCSFSSCSDASTTCVLGSCICQDGWKPDAGKSECIKIHEEGIETAGGTRNTCRVLLTASPFTMDVGVDMMHIRDHIIKRIKEAKSSVLIDSQYFIGNRGSCDNTCPQNNIVLALKEKVEKEMREGRKFAVVIITAGKTEFSHLPTLKTLFARKPELAFVPSIQKTANDLFLNWQDYVFVGTAMMVADLAYMRLHDGPDYLDRLDEASRAMAPGENEVTAHPPFVHSKMFIIDGEFVIVGSANLNDRSMMAPDGDAELSVEVAGPAAREFLETSMQLYLGPQGKGSATNDADLAKLMHKVAMENNGELERLFGANLAIGTWTSPLGSMSVAPCCCSMSTGSACTRKLHCGGGSNTAEDSHCERALLFPGSENKDASVKFIAWLEGEPLHAKVGTNDHVRWQGIIVPFSANLWGTDFEYWEILAQRAPIAKKTFY